MLNFFKQKPAITPSGPKGMRAYIIGDIHGCFDALKSLLNAIENHESHQTTAQTSIVFLGDLIDRGPKSNEVLDYLVDFAPNFATCIYLMGNHEEVFLDILGGDADLIRSWFEFGGSSCARSYGVENLGQVNIDPSPLFRQLRKKVPQKHIDFISGFKDYHIFGDYVCVHAGIKPKVKLELQKPRDLRWIRAPFLNFKKLHSHIVVHGHTIVEKPAHFGNRIAIDTGAYNGGPLTALCIDGVSTQYLSAYETKPTPS